MSKRDLLTEAEFEREMDEIQTALDIQDEPYVEQDGPLGRDVRTGLAIIHVRLHDTALRAALAKAEKRIDEMRVKLDRVTAWTSGGHPLDVDGWDALLDQVEQLRLRAEKAEAERDEAWKLAEQCRRDRAAVLMVKTTDGLTSSEWLMRTALAERERDAERARAETYLAAIREAEHIAMKGVCDINDGTWISDIAALLRPLVEEARRG